MMHVILNSQVAKKHGTVIGGVSENKCFERYCLRQKSQRPCAGKRGGEKTCGTFHDVSLKLPAFHCKTVEFHRFFNSTNINHERVLEQLQFQTRQWFQIVESKHCGPIEKQKHQGFTTQNWPNGVARCFDKNRLLEQRPKIRIVLARNCEV